MTDVVPERVNGHAKPKTSLLKFVPEPAAEQAEQRSPRVRRRVRIDSLRNVVVETRKNGAYRLTVRHGAYLWAGLASLPAGRGTRGRPHATSG
ncbi:hypothetical protein MBT84_32870 [Streptomyces sp. MBT84]|uniref:hypothetical protein n=1 Tax=Streptomyces sp. MBT84 TaxID=1488414 RepID=UPI001D8A4CA6|nr:hypothetical protein [Streptomyces sp. MBT84]MBW8704403.1 hypothetical protein [Streptomyces sp. MBT84]